MPRLEAPLGASSTAPKHKLGDEDIRHGLNKILLGTGLTLTAEVLGKGTYSSVYVALLPTGAKVAIKCAHDLYSDEVYAEEGHLHTVAAMAGSALPIAQFVNKAGCAKIFVFPFVDKSNFKYDAMNMTMDGIRVYAVQMLTSLARLHRTHIVHRDLKPKNLLSDGWTVLLTDFGLSDDETSLLKRGVDTVAGAIAHVAADYTSLQEQEKPRPMPAPPPHRPVAAPPHKPPPRPLVLAGARPAAGSSLRAQALLTRTVQTSPVSLLAHRRLQGTARPHRTATLTGGGGGAARGGTVPATSSEEEPESGQHSAQESSGKGASVRDARQRDGGAGAPRAKRTRFVLNDQTATLVDAVAAAVALRSADLASAQSVLAAAGDRASPGYPSRGGQSAEPEDDAMDGHRFQPGVHDPILLGLGRTAHPVNDYAAPSWALLGRHAALPPSTPSKPSTGRRAIGDNGSSSGGHGTTSIHHQDAEEPCSAMEDAASCADAPASSARMVDLDSSSSSSLASAVQGEGGASGSGFARGGVGRRRKRSRAESSKGDEQGCSTASWLESEVERVAAFAGSVQPVPYERYARAYAHRTAPPTGGADSRAGAGLRKSLKVPHPNKTGTSAYKPPEQLVGYPLLAKSADLWAAGVTLLSLLSKRYPLFPVPGKSDAHGKGRADGAYFWCLWQLLGDGMGLRLAEGCGRSFIAVPLAAHSRVPRTHIEGVLSIIPEKRREEPGFALALHLCLCLLNPDPALRVAPDILLFAHPFINKATHLQVPSVQGVFPERADLVAGHSSKTFVGGVVSDLGSLPCDGLIERAVAAGRLRPAGSAPAQSSLVPECDASVSVHQQPAHMVDLICAEASAAFMERFVERGVVARAVTGYAPLRRDPADTCRRATLALSAMDMQRSCMLANMTFARALVVSEAVGYEPHMWRAPSEGGTTAQIPGWEGEGSGGDDADVGGAAGHAEPCPREADGGVAVQAAHS